MEDFISYILQFGNLNQQQIALISKKATQLTLQKDEFYLEAGKISKQFGFVTDGILRVSYFNNKGEEITKYFIDENNIVVDLESFDNEIPSIAYVQAMTDCKIIAFSKRDWHELLDTIIGWDAIVRKIVSKALLQKVERISAIVAQDATTGYLTFLQKFPNLANRIPLSYLASYLGITQSSLSRIRKKIR
ncbi:cyclic nucleotide-binding domain-containing protein [Pedobacter petrophilus]|uniref:Cyclic nucleotide-binding domain-containing protein n=1 Tax=Pedobacter petrophilus TaxID=1908241 RepID=A0A7K0G1K2_9SPHI|nr:Crp/Fnr family transcriptional regulator [Pedobacter petrophilus]MRX77723.1 cyclic nucleotide-binding domain-containing protein [Pedobacter petrophilus]